MKKLEQKLGEIDALLSELETQVIDMKRRKLKIQTQIEEKRLQAHIEQIKERRSVKPKAKRIKYKPFNLNRLKT